MPDLQPHERMGASRRSVDRAGDLLRDWLRSGSILLSPHEQEAERLVERFRHEFEVPLTKVVMGLRSFLTTEGVPVEVGQRLKRRPRIIEKLVRHPNMRLTSMQDVAGGRALLPDLATVQRIHDRIDRAGWDVVRVDDYNATPKASGYRSLHIVVRRDATMIEIQLRTDWQQAWARAVERLDARYSLALKDERGPDALLRYLERMAYALDITHRHEAVERQLQEELAVLEQEAARWLSDQEPNR
jgi:Uncharacterized protein conserved in bacteria